jgi:hypothetical protein
MECPICFKTETETSEILSQVCTHFVCNECFVKLNKCPICRRQYDQNDPLNETNVVTDQEDIEYDDDDGDEQEYDDDDDTVVIPSLNLEPAFDLESFDLIPEHVLQGEGGDIPRFDGTDEIPTTALFNGRLWFNTESKQINIYLNGEWLTEETYKNNDEHYEAEQLKVVRLVNLNANGFCFETNCQGCGIQRTIKANRYILFQFLEHQSDNNRFEFKEGRVYIDDQDWGTNAFDDGMELCLTCYVTRENICSQLLFHRQF